MSVLLAAAPRVLPSKVSQSSVTLLVIPERGEEEEENEDIEEEMLLKEQRKGRRKRRRSLELVMKGRRPTCSLTNDVALVSSFH